MPETLLNVDQLQKRYGDFEALRNISFTARRGELVCIVGPSGCGKTTLLKIIAGLLSATSGKVELDGVQVTGPHPRMAVVFQEYGRSLMPWMTVRGNVELPLRSKLTKAERRAKSDAALEAVGLGAAGSKYPWQLSGGMQQRVAIARAVAYDPEILIMDEPFAAVDAQTRADLEDLVRDLWAKLGVTVLFVTHDIDESIYLGERVVVLSMSPTVVQEDLEIDLPVERDQITTRAMPRFTELRTHIHEEVQRAKRGATQLVDDH
ncbi:MAG TPA: ABC transporter ATP-binding protein [Microbacteriaceae bacterium]|nr:ABC transporter ATP-binding protein [Microbacteriaceae bacterium]